MPDGQPSNRRDFLKGKSALEAVRKGDIAKLAMPNFVESHRAQTRQANYLEQYSKNAMACEFEIFFNMQQYSQSGIAAMQAFQLIDELEDQLTVYRDHSEVSRLNVAAAKQKIAVKGNLFRLLRMGSQIHNETAGAFDMTAASLSQLWGFEQRQGKVPTMEAILATLGSVGGQHLLLDPLDQTVQFRVAGLNINLGGIGKGFALDEVAHRFRKLGVLDFLIHGGQSSVLAGGSSTETNHPPRESKVDVELGNESLGGKSEQILSDQERQLAGRDIVLEVGEAVQGYSDPRLSESQTDNKASGWFVGLSHPTVPEKRLAEIRLVDQALGTSGTGRQGFFHQGRRYGHILDPRTGWPTDHFLSTTVISKSAAVSDALATAFFVMSLEEVTAYCQLHPDVSALVVLANPKSKRGELVLVTFNLLDSDWRRLS